MADENKSEKNFKSNIHLKHLYYTFKHKSSGLEDLQSASNPWYGSCIMYSRMWIMLLVLFRWQPKPLCPQPLPQISATLLTAYVLYTNSGKEKISSFMCLFNASIWTQNILLVLLHFRKVNSKQNLKVKHCNTQRGKARFYLSHLFSHY